MKRLFTILIAVLFAFGIGGCKKNDEKADKKVYSCDEVFDIAKSNMDVSQMEEADADMLNLLMSIDAKDFTELKYLAPQTNLNTNQILVVKGNDEVDKKIDEYLKNETELYESYLPEEAQKLKNAEKFKVGDLTVLLIGNSKEEVSKARAAIEK